MQTHTVVKGDTFAAISTKAYGVADRAALIAGANPHLTGGLQVGATVKIPEILAAVATEVTAQSGEEVSISVNGKQFRHWVSYELQRGIDQVAKFKFVTPFEPLHQAFRDTFRPLGYQQVDIHVGGEQLFRGVLLHVQPNAGAGGRFCTVSGYASCGVLQDCSLPPSAFADSFGAGGGIEWNFQTLEQIVEDTGKYFSMFAEFADKPEGGEGYTEGTQFTRVALQPANQVWQFWVTLAKQRNLVIGSNAMGSPRFSRSTSVAATQVLEGGVSPVRTIASTTDPQRMFSSVTGLSPVIEGEDGGAYTVDNPFMADVLRPYVFSVSDAESSAVAKAAVDAKASRMFGGGIGYQVTLVGSRNSAGEIWQPNTRLLLTAPDVQIYEQTEFLIRSVLLEGGQSSSESAITVVLPSAFDGSLPKAMPWGVA